MAAGFARVRHGSDLDPLIVLTVLTWTVYGAFLILRFGIGWRGRRAAYTALVGFALVIALQLSLQDGAFRMNLVLVGTSHRLAPVEVRERVALDLDGSAELARRLADGGEAVCLSTCNRTELYLAHRDPELAESLAGAALAEGEIELYRLRDEAAALHLFRVAAGLDSLVPGEGEILGQVRAAYEAGACGPVLDRLFRQALHAGKKVRAETAIGESPASVSSAAAALAQQVFGELEGCRVLLVGAGEVSELAARSLAARGASIAAVTSRTQERAEELAARFGGQAVPFDRVGEELARADVVVSSTSAPGYVLTADRMPERKGRPLFRDRPRRPARRRARGRRPRRLLPLRHRRPGGGRQRKPQRALAGGGARRVDGRARGRAVPRLAGLARRRSGDRLAPRARREHPLGRAGQGRRAGSTASPRASGGRSSR